MNDWDKPRSAYSGRSIEGGVPPAPAMPTSVNPSPLPRGSLNIPMPDVPPPKAWSMQETRLAKELRLPPAPIVQPYWKAIKHAGLRVEKEYVAPPPPQDFIYLHGEPAGRPWWWIGYAVIGTLAMVIVIVLSAYRIGPYVY